MELYKTHLAYVKERRTDDGGPQRSSRRRLTQPAPARQIGGAGLTQRHHAIVTGAQASAGPVSHVRKSGREVPLAIASVVTRDEALGHLGRCSRIDEEHACAYGRLHARAIGTSSTARAREGQPERRRLVGTGEDQPDALRSS